MMLRMTCGRHTSPTMLSSTSSAERFQAGRQDDICHPHVICNVIRNVIRSGTPLHKAYWLTCYVVIGLYDRLLCLNCISKGPYICTAISQAPWHRMQKALLLDIWMFILLFNVEIWMFNQLSILGSRYVLEWRQACSWSLPYHQYHLLLNYTEVQKSVSRLSASVWTVALTFITNHAGVPRGASTIVSVQAILTCGAIKAGVWTAFVKIWKEKPFV